mmetsp:Transcript_22159/g.34079  ORF Transcript_22159/g.34079 Transcript_22159/m.34079 type:complete len:86 (+) Transcript_22159:659-916(+)
MASARYFNFVCAGASNEDRVVDTAPPADHPPSWAFPTAAFHVGLCAVVMRKQDYGYYETPNEMSEMIYSRFHNESISSASQCAAQ